MLYSMTYVCSACVPLTRDALKEIFAAWTHSDRREAVTGLLLYRNGHFLQVIEGSRRKLEDKRQREVLDPRTHNLFTIESSFILAREFREWPMPFLDLSDGAWCSPGQSDPMFTADFTDAFFLAPGNARKLVHHVRASMRSAATVAR